MAKLKLTRLSRILIILGALAIVFFGGRFFLNNTDVGQNIQDKVDQVAQEAEANQQAEAIAKEKAKEEAQIQEQAEQERRILEAEEEKIAEAKAEEERQKIILDKKELENVLVVQVKNTGGFVPGIFFNNGWDANEESRFFKEYGLKVKFELSDFEESRKSWKANEIDLISQTVDALPTEIEDLATYNPQVIMQLDWSRGDYALVTKSNISSINNLKGKKIAVTPASAFHTYLIKLLDAAGMNIDEVSLYTTDNKDQSLAAFTNGKVDAAIICTPNNKNSIRQIQGSKVLHSTKIADFLIADLYIAKKDYLTNNRDKINAFYQGWMTASAEINTNPNSFDSAARLFAVKSSLSESQIKSSMRQTRFVTHGDNKNFFNKNGSYNGSTGKSLYSDMGKIYAKLGLSSRNRLRWESIADLVAVNSAESKLTGPEHNAEIRDTFPEPPANAEGIPFLTSKPVSINFASGSFQLSQSAKGLIDVKMANLLKAFTNSRIRIEGNTDNNGNRDINIELSRKRAQSVAYYLLEKYKIDENRLIIKGNGPDKPVKGCRNLDNVACRTKNKRTEFQFIK